MPGATRLKSIGLLTYSSQNRLLCVRFSFFCLRRVLFGFASSFSQTGYLFLFLLTPRHFLLPLLECLTCHKASSGCRHRAPSPPGLQLQIHPLPPPPHIEILLCMLALGVPSLRESHKPG